MRTSDNDLYKVFRGRATVWVRNGTPTDPVLRRVVPQKRLRRLPGYTSYEVGRQVRRDCLHAAEELINNKPGELEEGGGLHSTITTASEPREQVTACRCSGKMRRWTGRIPGP